MKFTHAKSSTKKVLSNAKNIKNVSRQKVTVTFGKDITGKLYKLNLLGKKDREQYEKKVERDTLVEAMYKNLLILQTSHHDEKKKKKIINTMKSLDDAAFVHFHNIFQALTEYDVSMCTRVIESIHVNKICSLYTYIGFKISFKYFKHVYSGLYEITVKSQ